MSIPIPLLLLRSIHAFFCTFISRFLIKYKLFHILCDNDFKSLYLQLCLALADLALQMCSWQKPVVDLITRFGGNNANLWPLLEILTVLPEEANSRSLRYNIYLSFHVIKMTTKEANKIVSFLHLQIRS